MYAPNHTIEVFVKAPIPGTVKTRLAAGLSHQDAARLYRCFVEDTVTTALSVAPVTIRYAPEHGYYDFRDWLGDSCSYGVQSGQDLGRRMAEAFLHQFDQGTGKCLVIGSDLPDISADTLAVALDALETTDAVLGPSEDGGYYLIGFSNKMENVPACFSGIAWSTDTVFRETTERFSALGISWQEFPVSRDIDTLPDLAAFLKRQPEDLSGSAPKTCHEIRRMNLQARLAGQSD